MHSHKLAAPLFLLGFALPSIALTLGQPQGAAWVGRPLDIVIPVSLAEGERRDSLCAEAELMQGSTRVDDRRVTVSVGAASSSGAVRLHVHSTVPVDEPVVQLTVRAGCEMNSSRQYVLLADMPSDVSVVGGTEAAAPRSLPAVTPRSEPFGVVRGAASSSTAADVDNGAATVPATAPRARPVPPRPATVRNRNEDRSEGRRPVQRAAAPRRAVASAKPPVVASAAPAAVAAAAQVPQGTASGARLQLDGLDPASVRHPASAASAPASGASAAAAPSPAQGASAPAGADAAAVAAAIAQPDELQRANERLQSLEATLKGLREQSAQNQRMLMEMRSELAEARDSRYANPLVYLLTLLLLLALIALALLWRVVRNGGDRPAWWGDAPLKDDGGPSSIAPQAIAPFVKADAGDSIGFDRVPAVVPVAATSNAVATQVDEPAHSAHFDDTVPQSLDDAGTPARYVNTEELFDVQQQSDFFVSLGQHDQAIAVLSEHIADNPETSALAYLDLLRIFHSLERREDYTRVASEFERAFNAEVPAFDQFSEAGNGLEHYRTALARIEAEWPEPGTLGLIEELVFRKPGARGGDESFDLAAYRELLLLYSVAKEVIDPHSAPPTPVTPLSFLDTHDAALESTMLHAPDVPPMHDMQETQPDALRDDAVTVPGASLPSIYGTLDKGMTHDTVLGTDTELAALERAQREAASGIIDFDTTLLTTTPAALDGPDASQRPSPAPADWLSFDIEPTPPLDLQLFDPATEAEIAPKPKRQR